MQPERADMTSKAGRSPSAKEWRWLDEHPDYMVSSQGDVRHRRVGSPFLAGDTDPKGYRRVMLGGKHRRVARLVCEAFHGRCPAGHECGHLDGNKRNNSAENLAWVTRSENTMHSVAHGTHHGSTRAGEAHPQSKLKPEQVESIRTKAEGGMSRRALAREFGISATQIHRIVTKERWANA